MNENPLQNDYDAETANVLSPGCPAAEKQAAETYGDWRERYLVSREERSEIQE